MRVRYVAAAVGLIAGLVSAENAFAAGVYSNDFSLNSNGFTGGTVTTAPSGENFLSFGGAGGQATLGLTGLASHTTVTLNFTLDVVGSMDGTGPTIAGGGSGDFFTVSSGSSQLFNQAFANYGGGNHQTYPTPGSAPGTGATTIDALKYSGFPDSGNGIQDSEYNFSISLASGASDVSFLFHDGSNEGAGNEFYGIDNVSVSISGTSMPGVPLPASAPLFGAALAAFGAIGYGVKRKKAATAA